MGAVYLATQLSLNRVVALKLLAANLGDDPGFRARFEREGQVQAALDHDHIVPVYEAGQSEFGLFIAMRLIDGPTLKQLILDGSLDARRTVRLLSQVAHALDTAHRAGLIHRDIKPQNVLIGSTDHAYLADFGLIKAPDEARLTGTGQFIGTIDYVAPEQVQAEPATPASDIYSLTGVLYECLTGEVPYPRPSEAAVLHAHVMQPPPKVSELRPDLPAALDDVIAQGMAKDPWSRPSLATELLQAASRALSSIPQSAAAGPAAERDGTIEHDRPSQTTKLTVAVTPGSPPPPGPEAPSAAAPLPRAQATKVVDRPHPEPSAEAPVAESSVAAPPTRLVALIAAITLAAFAAGFVVGLIVH